MSLDVYLTVPGTEPSPIEAVFIREGGFIRAIGPDEWAERFPDGEFPNVYGSVTVYDADRLLRREVYSRNITHNLGKMAGEAGIYEALWRPEETGITKAGQLIEPLRDGLKLLRSDPERFKAFNPSNKLGDYDGLVQFVASYLAACEENPEADVSVSR